MSQVDSGADLAHARQARSPRSSRGLADVYRQHGVPHRVDEGRGGWISTHCCFCAGSADYHLGFSVEGGFFKCWRCGFRPGVDVLVRLCRVSRSEAAEIYRDIRGNSLLSGASRALRVDREAQARVGISRYRRPSDVGPMRPNHRRYLERRGFDPDLVEREWGVLGLGPVARLDGVDLRHRLFVPVLWGGEEASFQTRDVTGKSDLKYISCPTDREVAHHKHVLYGRQERWGDVGIVVEGVTDVWKLGPRACAVFGISYTTEQVLEIVRYFRRVAIVFDAERRAQAQARRLAASVRLRLGVEPVVVDLGDGTDPGSMAQDDADHLVRELTR